jgi:hypothetical protein
MNGATQIALTERDVVDAAALLVRVTEACVRFMERLAPIVDRAPQDIRDDINTIAGQLAREIDGK